MAGAEIQGKTAQIVVRFLSNLITVTRDASGTVVDGSPEAVVDVTDVWTFARTLGSRDPNWQLVATEAGQ
jgi:predicted lipid-binding transport protein (Tim44 family)